VLRYKRISRGSLSLVFVTDSAIRNLNQKFLNRRYATDVLAFDYGMPSVRRKDRKTLSGEIVISTDMACRQAKKYGTSTQREIILYIIHGILHLLGFDDHAPQDSQRMKKEEIQLLRLVGAIK